MKAEERTRSAIGRLLSGHAPNGIQPSDCGNQAELIQSLYDAHATGGTAAARGVFEELARQDSALASFRSGDRNLLATLERFSAAQLQAMELPEPTFVVEGVVPEGTTLLAAAPKVGKTLLALNISLALATGGRAMGKVKVDTSRVLFLALEGSKRGLKRRIETMLGGEAAPHLLDFYRTWPSMDDGCLAMLRLYLKNHPDTGLVVIDTLKRVRGRGNARRNAYDEDYEALQPISALMEEMGRSAIVIHHTNKRDSADVMDQVSGSTGLTGAVDNVLIMQKERGQVDATLTVIPREEEEAEYALTFDPQLMTWVLAGNAEDFAKTRERQRILDVLKACDEPLGPQDIAAASGQKYGNVRYLLSQMLKDGEVAKEGRGAYRLPLLP
jgi:hypothetical protein